MNKLGTICGFRRIYSRPTGETNTVLKAMDVLSYWDDARKERCIALFTDEDTVCLGREETKRLIELLQEA